MKGSRAAHIAYIVIAAVLCLTPSVGLLFGGGEVSADSDAAPAPALVRDDGSPNLNVLSDAGAWFDDHFAFRNEYVTAAAKLASVFGVSTNESVVLGSDGWLYYGDSVDDYQGLRQLTDRQLFDIAHSMKLVQTYVQSHGAAFAFTIAPNKSTLYGEHMPYYLQVRTGDSNLERIEPILRAEGVHYVDALKLLSADELGELGADGLQGGGQAVGERDAVSSVLYHARDSHWNNVGAARVAGALLDALDQGHRDYSDEPYEVRADFAGDLDGMLFPSLPTLEDEAYYTDEPVFSYVTEDPEGNFAPKIETMSGASGSLVMYRDSFCNSLLPFMAESYGLAYFSRGIPYQLARDLPEREATAVVVERAQRFMRDMAANPPLVPAPLFPEDELAADFSFEVVETEQQRQGDYLCVTGLVPAGDMPVDARIAVRVNGGLVYEAFGTSDAETGREGFQVLVPLKILRDEGNVYEVGAAGSATS